MKTNNVLKISLSVLLLFNVSLQYLAAQDYQYFPGKKYWIAEKQFLKTQGDALDYLDSARSGRLSRKKRSLSRIIKRKLYNVKKVRQYSDNPRRANIYRRRVRHQQTLINNFLAKLALYHESFKKFRTAWFKLQEVRKDDEAAFYKKSVETEILKEKMERIRKWIVSDLPRRQRKKLRRLYRRKSAYQTRLNRYYKKGPRFYKAVIRYKKRLKNLQRSIIRILCSNDSYNDAFEKYRRARKTELAARFLKRKQFYKQWLQNRQKDKQKDKDDGLD